MSWRGARREARRPIARDATPAPRGCYNNEASAARGAEREQARLCLMGRRLESHGRSSKARPCPDTETAADATLGGRVGARMAQDMLKVWSKVGSCSMFHTGDHVSHSSVVINGSTGVIVPEYWYIDVVQSKVPMVSLQS